MKPAIGGVRVREDLWSLAKWDPTLLWYAKAVAVMRTKALDSADSWRYQAAIHGYDATYPPLKAIARPGDKVPANVRDVWSQCQHNSWYFLPWHRGYLGCFEAIVRETIRALPDAGAAKAADDWALPYWNYTDSAAGGANARFIRPEFIETKLPDGSANMLAQGIVRASYTLVTTPLGKAGNVGLTAANVSLAALTQPAFTDQFAVPTFGGSWTGFNHKSGNMIGQLERTPHGDVHMAVGGWMSSFETAGLDPLFWLHHCNIDRLWEVWRSKSATHTDPTETAWKTPASAVTGKKMPFILHHPKKANYTFVPSDMVDTVKSLFAYRYDAGSVKHLPPGFGGVLESATGPTIHPSGSSIFSSLEAEMKSGKPEMIGSSRGAVSLDGKFASAEVSIEQPRKMKLRSWNNAVLASVAGEEESAEPLHIYLNVEHVTADADVTPYTVYLNIPDGDDPAKYTDRIVGTMPMFGVREASRVDATHDGGGLSYVFDVTALVGLVAPDGDLSSLHVAFVPQDGEKPAPGLKVGKISFSKR